MPSKTVIDAIDARLLLKLAERPRATTVALADAAGIARNTAQARLARMEENGALDTVERRVRPEALGYPLTAFITAEVTQRRLAEVAGEITATRAELRERHGWIMDTYLLRRERSAE